MTFLFRKFKPLADLLFRFALRAIGLFGQLLQLTVHFFNVSPVSNYADFFFEACHLLQNALFCVALGFGGLLS